MQGDSVDGDISSTPLTSKKGTRVDTYEYGVEGARGLAALAVLYTHLLTSGDLDPGYDISSFWEIFEISQGAVLFFFVLSGYVIGLTNKRKFELKQLKSYFFRRMIRIVPLYWIAIALSCFVRPIDSFATIIGNIFFLQSHYPYGTHSIPPMLANSNLWSLNCEVIYYVLFPIIWYTGRIGVFFFGSFLLSILCWMLPSGWAENTSCCMIGWTFWIGGYWLAKTAVYSDIKVSPWVSLICFSFITWQLKPLWRICLRLGWLPDGYSTWVHASYIDFLPCCIVFLLLASRKRFLFSETLYWLTAIVPVGYLVFSLVRGNVSPSIYNSHIWFAVLGCFFWKIRFDCSRFFQYFSYVGSISYGVYIFQRPVQWFVRDATIFPSGSAFSFCLRLVTCVVVTVVVAHVAEKIIQRYVKSLFTGSMIPEDCR